MTTLALYGGTPVRTDPWPSWPPPMDDAQRALVTAVLESGRWGATQGGQACADLVAAFARRSGVEHGVAVGNATLGLFAALRGLGVGPGDEVIVPAYTFVATATAVLLAGATPVIADVDATDLHLSAPAVEAALTPRTAAIVPVHLAGSPADMDPLNAIAARHGLAVVEDAAQAHGATYRGRPVGGLGDAGVYSFQSSKAMTAGEGGLVVCRAREVHEAVWSVCNVGRALDGAWYGHPRVGWNLRLTELQAALLLPWLDRLDDEIDRRNAFAAAVERELPPSAAAVARELPPTGPPSGPAPVTVVPPPPGTTRDSRHLLMLRFHVPFDRSFLLAAMAAEGVPLDEGYPPLGTMPALTEAGARTQPCPNAEAAAREVLWVRQPMLMADPTGAEHLVEALTKVLAHLPA
ncbi:DegT/DnrJ/EryC1/StrS family aminotransferase [Nonomuraea gerenzanensis]|uniref:Lipopolysaccharide biosynthesis protein RffA n=1 Tax=Nonomuraea gerenzanensis TaxID=93944 RepID=A0A1M4EM44_9ACTN|nr:DegT/DnrJ/EryC1/StrS family aminotransferase [Nonomuraea gerenzanensis]UBU11429.1 DegT/DnrJ/EryC1/StrS family aminotransferase [Nonomuraea gerenzanensis]SBO99912.1 Lipopolysaccharide biosynthesis protein RffA [Nonomuraea gerenzanensis]